MGECAPRECAEPRRGATVASRSGDDPLKPNLAGGNTDEQEVLRRIRNPSGSETSAARCRSRPPDQGLPGWSRTHPLALSCVSSSLFSRQNPLLVFQTASRYVLESRNDYAQIRIEVSRTMVHRHERGKVPIAKISRGLRA